MTVRSRFPVLMAGIGVRVIVWATLYPFNRDDHLGVISWILRTRTLPTSEVGNQGFQPPLYYLLALPWTIGHSAKLLQAFSLLLSLLNFLLLFAFVSKSSLIRTEGARRQALWIAALLPQFVIFGDMVSNDALAFLLGTLILIQALRYLALPTTRNLVYLAAALGAGLLTKGAFLAFVPVVVLIVVVSGVRRKARFRTIGAGIALLCAVSGLLGSYKYLENLAHFGHPIVHGMDFRPPWMLEQQGTFRGIRSVSDVNVFRLVGDPFETKETLHSYPLLLYATFWYSYIHESSFDVTRFRYRAIPRAIAGLALLATALIIGGGVVAAARCRRLGKISDLSEEEYVARASEAALLLFVVSNLAIVLAAGFKYDAWSCFQGRLLFPSILGIVFFLAWGLDTLANRSRGAFRAAIAGLSGLAVLFAVELGVEAASALIAALGGGG